MNTVFTRYKNKKFIKERVELDGKAFENCTFGECLIVLEKGETEIKNCVFERSRLMLRGQALQIAKILQNFIGEKPLKVLDFAEPGIFKKEIYAPESSENKEGE
ncbi:MAG: hypothetical protein ACUVWV_07955 [Thermodesulfobacteriota bacterium]